MWMVEMMSSIKRAAQAVAAACIMMEEFFEDGEVKKEKVLEFAMELWEKIDPTPSINLDDEIVEAILSWAIDTFVDVMNEKRSSKNMKVS